MSVYSQRVNTATVVCSAYTYTCTCIDSCISCFQHQVVQLQELFEVRHSVFIVGNAGTGKSMVWKSLFKANQNMKKKPTAIDLNPKAVTNDELFGIINPATREWKDGKTKCRKLRWRTLGQCC